MAQPISSLRTNSTGPTLFDQLSTEGQLSAEDRYGMTGAGESQFTKGLRSGAAGLTAGSFAGEALRQEAAGNAAYTDSRDRALQTVRDTQMYAPRVSSLRNVGSVNDAADFAAGAVGQGAMSMAPSLAAAALMRGRGALGKATAFGGAMVPAYEMERGEAALSQYQDPEQMAAPVAERDFAASAKGGINAALESIVPAGIGGSLLRKPAGSLLGHVGRDAVTEGVTEGAQQLVGYGAKKHINQKEELDPWELADAVAAGALTGGAAAGALRGPAHAAQQFMESQPAAAPPAAPEEPALGGAAPNPEPAPEGGSDTALGRVAGFGEAVADRFGEDAKEAGKKAMDLGSKAKGFVDETIDKMTDAVNTSQNPGEFLSKVFGGTVEVEEEAQADMSEEPNLALRGATFEETEANMAREDESKMARATRYGEELLNDPATPQEVQDRVASFGGDYTSPEAQDYVRRTLVSQRGSEKLGRAAKDLVDLAKGLGAKAVDVGGAAVEGAKDVAGKAVQGAEDRIVKKNLQSASPAESAAFGKVVFDGLTDEAKANPQVRAQLSQVTNALMAFAAKTGDVTARDLPTLTKLSNAMQLFKDPDAMAAQLVEYGAIPRDADSFISRIKSIQNAQTDLKQPNSFLVSALTPEAKKQLTAPMLKRVAQLVDEFSVQDMAGQGDRIIQGLAQAFGSPESAQAVLDYYSQQNKSQLMFDENEMLESPDRSADAKDAPKATYRFKDAKTLRPFFKGSKGLSEARRDGTVGSESTQTAVGYDQYVGENNGDGDKEVNRLIKDIDSRIEQHEARKDEDRTDLINALKGEKSIVQDAYVRGGAQEALSMYEVLRTEGKDQNDLVATDEDLAKYAYKKGANRVTFKRTDGTKLMLSAESMWKSYGDKEQGEVKGNKEGETARARRLFKEAVASVMARPEIESMETKMSGLKLNDKGTLADPKENPELRERIAHELNKASESLETQKAALQRMFKEYAKALSMGNLGKADMFTFETQLQKRIDQAKEAIQNATTMPQRAVLRERLLNYERGLERVQEMRENHEDDGVGGNGNTDEGPTEGRTRLRTEMDKPGVRTTEEDTGKEIGGRAPRTGTGPSRPKAEPGTARQSTMDPLRGNATSVLTKDEKQKIVDEVVRMRGKKIKVAFGKFADIGGSGEFSMNKDKTERLIRIAISSLNPMSVAYHESLHDFMAMLGGSKNERKMKADLLAAADAPQVRARLKALLKDHPKALEQIEKDPEERLAYLFQFWQEGLIPLGSTGTNIFSRAVQFFRDMLGIVSEGQKVESIFEALKTGKFSEPSLAGAVIEDLKAETLSDKVRAASGPIGDAAEAMMTGATDRLRNTNTDALTELADLFHREAGREQGGELPFLSRRAQQVGKRLNALQNILEGTSAAERRAALENLQAMKTPSSQLEKDLTKYLADMHRYMVDKGVKRYDTEKKAWKPLGKVADYFPRVWDKENIRNNEAEFIKLMTQHIGLDQARKTYNAIVNGDGSLELAENEHSLGFTPFNPAVLDRQFTFIDKSNADQFAKFQSKDMADIMTTYTQRAVHRAEYANTFGNDGEVIAEKFIEAQKQGATKKELAMAQKATMAMEGTLGYDFNPRLKEVMSGIVTYQNIVLLPLSLFSNLIDPLGIAMRSNDMKEAWKAFTYGIKGIADQIRGAKDDEGTELAKMLGIIDEQNMLEAMGHVYNSMHMSSFMKKINSKFFRYNGMEMWNQRMRVAALAAAERFILKQHEEFMKSGGEKAQGLIKSGSYNLKPEEKSLHSNPKRYLEELGLSGFQKLSTENGALLKTSADFEAAGYGKAAAEEASNKVQQALFKWVDSAVLRPNAAHRPIWGSDPRYQLIFHLKQFTFSFQNTILRRVGEELKHGNMAPAWILASYVPFMFLSDVLKGSLTGTLQTSSDLYDVASASIARSGILGTGVFGADAMGDLERGKLPGTSFLGPAFDHLMTLMQGITGGAGGEQVMNRSVPFAKFF